MVKMKKREEWILIFTLIFIILGTILMASSNSSLTKQNETAEEDGVQYVLEASNFSGSSIRTGANLTRHYEVGQKVSLALKIAPNTTTAMPDLLPLNFTIRGPSNEQFYVLFWIDPFLHNPKTGAIELALKEIEWGGDSLIAENTSSTTFIGRIVEDGNYQLVFEGGALTYLRLTYLALLKITLEKEYPYTSMLPLGILFVIAGALSGLWVIRITRSQRSIKRMKAGNGAK